jgi:predicted RNase H-like nuclease (RuvC/YqgF family)
MDECEQPTEGTLDENIEALAKEVQQLQSAIKTILHMAGTDHSAAAEGAKALLANREEQLDTLRREKQKAVPLETQHVWAQKKEAMLEGKLAKSKATAKQLAEQLATLQNKVRAQNEVVS